MSKRKKENKSTREFCGKNRRNKKKKRKKELKPKRNKKMQRSQIRVSSNEVQ